MNRIRMIAVVLSMVLFLLGAAGNTEEKQEIVQTSYEGIQVAEEPVVMEPTGKSEETQMEETQMKEPQMETPKEEAVPRRVIAVSEGDYKALLKLVEAEASGEDLKGKMLVANVVINRLRDGAFGSTIEEVIYQRVNGKAQFSPVSNGKMNHVEVSTETIEAVERVLCGEDESQGALYFAARAHADASNMAWFDRNLTWLFKHNGHEFFR